MRFLLPTWRDRVNRTTLGKDAIAGLTGALLVLPQGMAYAMIAGLPPQLGLYCAMVPAVLAALLGSSWHLVSGPTAPISIVVFATLSPLATPGSANYVQLALTLGFMVGCFQLLISMAQLGKLANFIPHSVIVGFTTGAAFLIAASQLKPLLGLDLPTKNGFFPTLNQVWQALPTFSGATLAVGLVTILATVGAKRWLKPLPHMVLGMVAGSAFAALLAATGLGSVALVGALPSALPPLSAPSWDGAVWQSLLGSAAVVGLLGLTEAIAIARGLALKSGQQVCGNRETLGQGAANFAGAFFSAYPSSGSFSRSGVNVEAGAHTPMSALFAAGLLVVLLLFTAPLIAYLPIAAMAGVLMIVAWGLIGVPAIRECFHQRSEAAVFVLTSGACMFVNVEIAVFSGIALAGALALWRRTKSDANGTGLRPL
jgi:sulfate permease, SulP family